MAPLQDPKTGKCDVNGKRFVSPIRFPRWSEAESEDSEGSGQGFAHPGVSWRITAPSGSRMACLRLHVSCQDRSPCWARPRLVRGVSVDCR